MNNVLGWHWLPDDGRIVAHGSSAHSGILVVPGLKLKMARPQDVELCNYGLHASKKPLDALQYASGSIVQRVRLSGSVLHGEDKMVASERKTLWVMDASLALHICAVNYAEIALDRQMARGETIDPRSRRALEVKRLWLRGQASDSERDAAWDAAWAAARAAAWAAARAAAWAAARDAARDAAWAAAWDAARDAARAAARAAAWDEQNAILTAALNTQYETGHGVRK